jgi:hypothetical protein
VKSAQFPLSGAQVLTIAFAGNWVSRTQIQDLFKETLVLTSPRSRGILGALDILVDIGAPAEKEVIL